MPRILAIVLIVMLTSTSMGASAKPPLKAYAAPPGVGLVTMSPSGRLMASRRTSDEADVIVVYDLEAGEMVTGVDISGVNPTRLSFLGEDQLVVSVLDTVSPSRDRRSYKRRAALVLDIASGEIRQLLHGMPIFGVDEIGTGPVVAASVERSSVLIPNYHGPQFVTDRRGLYTYGTTLRHGASFGLYEAFTNGNQSRLLRDGTPDTIDWFADLRNKRFVRVDYIDRGETLKIWLFDGDTQQLLLREQQGEKRSEPVGFAPGRDALLIKSYSDDGRLALFELPFDGGPMKGPVLGRPDKDVGRVLTDIDRVVIGVEYAGFDPIYQFFDEQLTSRMASLQASLSDSVVRLASHDADFSDLVLHVSGGVSPGAFLLSRRGESVPELVAGERPSIAATDVVPTATMSYRASDGLEIPALLTARRDVREAGGAPLVVLQNGGPEPHDSPDFDWVAQYFASRGYVVFLPQPRGTFGFGEEFFIKGRETTQFEAFDDLEDGVHHLVELGLADPGRVCVIGISFGGYTALAAGQHSRELYQCAVSINGFSDPNQMRIKPRFTHWLHARNLFYRWSLPGKLRYDSESSGTLALTDEAHRIQTSVLLVHAEEDSVIPATQSRDLHEALVREGKSSEFIELPGHDHWLSEANTRLAALNAMSEFVEKHIGDPEQPRPKEYTGANTITESLPVPAE